MTTDSLTRPLHVIIGPEQHGVVRHAHRITAAVGALIFESQAVPTRLPQRPTVVMHFTDRLFGADPDSAATAFVNLTEARERVVTVLHDLPQSSDGTGHPKREECYRRVIEASDQVVVSSQHELGLVDDLGGSHGTTVVPLPIDPCPVSPRPLPPGPARIATLGFIYPGKGIEEIIDAVAAVSNNGTCQVINVGAPSPGHEYLVEELTDRAAQQGVSWSTTGWVDEAEVDSWLTGVDVPIAYHRHLSASASINSWLGIGRRPIVPISPYVTEVERRCPGALWVIPAEPEALRHAVLLALEDPRRTILDPALVVGPSSLEVGRALEALG